MSSTFRRTRPTTSAGTAQTSHLATDSSPSDGVNHASHSGGVSLLLPGTKPWTGGITLTSTGLREWDDLLLGLDSASGSTSFGGGGQALGTAIYIGQDRWTMHLSLALLRYYCAQVRVACVQSVFS
jgi:hypothetical protein